MAGNNTSTVTQDDQGFLWFINGGKIHRYNGRNFLTCLPPAGSPAAREPLLGLASWQDSLLFLWSDHAAFLFNPKTDTWQNVKMKEEHAQNKEMHFWQRSGKDNILIYKIKTGFPEVTVWQFKHNQLAPAPFPKHLSTLNASTSFYWYDIDASGQTYLAYQDTLFQLDQSGNTIATPLDDVCTGCHSLYFQFESDGSLVLLANWRFFVLDREKNRFVPHHANRFLQAGQNHLHRFLLEKNGSIWACGQDRNLIYYDAVNDTLFNFQDELKELLPIQNDFKGLFQDKTGIIWVDTRMGLLKVKPQIYHFDTFFEGLTPSNAFYSFRGMAEDPRGMIYGVYYDGIARFDPAKKQPPRFYTFPRILNFFDLCTEGDEIWVNGGQLLDPASGTLKNVPSPFFENAVGDNGFFARDQNGTLWWAAHYSLLSLRKSEAGFQWIMELELPEKVYNKTEALHAGLQSEKLWISFKGNLLQYDSKTRAQRWFSPAEKGLPVSRIMAIEEDRGGKLWLATDAGLVYFDPTSSRAVRYTESDGLPDNFVCGMLTEGDSCLWLSTNHGLSRFHIPTAAFVNFLEEDGLSHNEFNRKSFFKAKNGQMFFGGMRGITTFFPEEVIKAYRSRNNGARMVLSSFEYTDERRDTILRQTLFGARPEFHLRHWDWSYTFEYALTDFGNPEEILYSYQMEGYKDFWSPPSKFNFARFNSLPSGEYVFRVRARDTRGRWHPNELAIKVVVYPPWWATWWAYTIYTMGLGALIYFSLRYELNRQKLRYRLSMQELEADRLKELDQFKSRLYTNLTHEFRTPLTVIKGMATQIQHNPEKYLENGTQLIENNSNQLLLLINQLLDLAKLENNSFKLHWIQGDIVPYLRYVAESFQSYANTKNLSLRFSTTLETCEMDYDAEQIKQILSNLLSNAIKFTPSGGDILVKLFEQEEKLRMVVQDTGIGIAPSEQPHIFDRFYQVDGSTTRVGKGTGIGLAHTQELVKIMGGSITVRSMPGEGSTFTVELPIHKTADRKNANTETRIDYVRKPTEFLMDESEENRPIGLPQVLLMEDNPDVVIYLKSCLEGLYQLDVAYNGKIGIEKALEHVPDLIISDVMMPEKDGFEVCDTLKNDHRTSHIPIILLTAKADHASRIQGLRRGADAYLAKPFDREELLVRLQMLVQRQKRLAAWFSNNQTVIVEDNQLQEAIQVEDAFIQRVRSIVEACYDNEQFGLPELCNKLSMSRSQLFRKMMALVQVSPSDYIRTYRLQRALELLQTTDLNVSEVAWKVGFKDPSYFSKSFQSEFGKNPREIAK